MAIQLKNICKSFGDKQVLQNINLTLHTGVITCLMGASGIGKTTLVNILAGTLQADSGEIIWPDNHRHVSVVFQEDRLLEWETALTNVLFVTNSTNIKYSNIDSNRACLSLKKSLIPDIFQLRQAHMNQKLLYAKQLLTQAGLADSINKKVAELSGGMKRRVSICRALISQSNLLILDEPFKGLDSETKLLIMNMVKQHLRKYMLCVTHDASELEFMGGKLITLDFS